MKNLLLCCVLAFGLAACGESPTPPANAPSTSSTTTSSDSDPKCGTRDVAAPAGDTDLTSCLATCEKLDDKAPEGTRCIPPRVACKSNCNTKYKK